MTQLPVHCARCSAAASSNLCDACAADLDAPLTLIAEQILSLTSSRGGAALLDRWGRAHRLGASTTLGRDPANSQVLIVKGSVSRRHASVRREADGSWWVRDEGSSGGTWVNDERVAEAQLAPGDQVSVGGVGFYFVLDEGQLVDREDPILSATLQPDTPSPLAAVPEVVEDEPTFVGLPSVELRFAEAPSGGGGYLDALDHRVPLTVTQFAMVHMLATRMVIEEAVSELVRGFVPTGQLIADLPWDAVDPQENHLKQLVRRIRKAFEAAGMGNLIESRRGFGYRLRVRPAPTSTGLVAVQSRAT